MHTHTHTHTVFSAVDPLKVLLAIVLIWLPFK
jgi:hypothetical protein